MTGSGTDLIGDKIVKKTQKKSPEKYNNEYSTKSNKFKGETKEKCNFFQFFLKNKVFSLEKQVKRMYFL